MDNSPLKNEYKNKDQKHCPWNDSFYAWNAYAHVERCPHRL